MTDGNLMQPLLQAARVNPLHRAAQEGNIDRLMQFLLSYPLYFEYGVDSTDSMGQTPLFYASSEGHEEVVKMLVSEFAADISVQDNHGRTAMLIAASSGHSKVVEALVDECNPFSMKDHSIFHHVCAYGDITLVRKLVCKGVDVNYRDSSGQTPLFHACRQRHLGVIQALVTEHQADVTIQDNDGQTAAMVAASNGHADVVWWLVNDCKVSLFTEDHSGATIFHHACAGGKVKCFQYLIETQNVLCNGVVNSVDFKDSMGQTPLFYACKMGHIDMTRALVSNFKADVAICDNLGRTAAMVAVLNGKDIFMKELVNVHVKDSKGQTLLHYACQVGKVDIVKDLITSYGADISAQDNENNTPLHKAACSGQQQVFMMFLNQRIISLAHRDHLGRTLLHIACIGNDVGLVKAVIASGCKADFSSVDSQGNTPIHVAALKGNDEVALMLIKDFKCARQKGQFGRTLLHSACAGGNLNLFRTLIVEYKASVSAKDDQNNTPLHVAACSGSRDIALVLISKFKCDPNSLGHLGRTLLHSACISGNSSLVQTLVDHYNAHTSLLATDFNGDTPLHTAAALGHSKCVEVLLSQGAPILVKNNSGKSSLDVAIGEARVLLQAYTKDN